MLTDREQVGVWRYGGFPLAELQISQYSCGMTIKIALIGLAIGLISGIIAALCGVGGGIFMVPLFAGLLGLNQKVALATSLAVIVPTALAASYKNASGGLIHWPVFFATAAGASVSAFFMADKLKSFQDATLTRFFAIVVIVMGIVMWIRAGKMPPNAPASTTAVVDPQQTTPQPALRDEN
jgi:uncharacterized membrane protein YfcA